MTQLALPTAPHNRTTTSKAAASMVNVSHQESMVLAVLAKGGLTQDEIAERTGLLRSAVAGRCNRLVFKGYIHTAGQRLTRYGRPAYVYWLKANKPQEGSNAGVTRDVPVRGIDRGVGCEPAVRSGQADAAQSQLTTASGGARTVGVVGDACPAAAKDRPLSGTQQNAGR